MAERRRRVVAVGLKSYLGYAQTLDWLAALPGLLAEVAGRVDVVVLPVAPALPRAVDAGREAGFAVGAQDVSDRPPGAYTGEVPAALLRELGVRYVEVGHAERRGLFGEGDDRVAAKTAAAVGQGLVPLVCVGEGRLGETSPTEPARAAAESIAQLDRTLAAVPVDVPVLVAYEPVWAIGAAEPAPVEHVRTVAAALRQRLEEYPAARLVYGGTAGPGLFPQLSDAVDGLFLGRRAHDPRALGQVLSEVGGTF